MLYELPNLTGKPVLLIALYGKLYHRCFGESLLLSLQCPCAASAPRSPARPFFRRIELRSWSFYLHCRHLQEFSAHIIRLFKCFRKQERDILGDMYVLSKELLRIYIYICVCVSFPCLPPKNSIIGVTSCIALDAENPSAHT